MKYLIDTCVISEVLRTNPEKKVLQWFEDCDEEFTFLSVLTIGEIQKGITKLPDNQRKIKIQKWLNKDLLQRFLNKIIPIDIEIASTWGQIQGEAESRGITIPSIDGLIGASAVAHNMTVVTRNDKDIQKTGARVLNPWKLED